MTYTRIKTVSGKKYKYLVSGKRVDGKVMQKVVSYLGPVEPIYKVKKRKKTNASVFAREISKEEKKELEKGKKSSKAFVRDRAKIILLSSEKKLSSEQIAENAGCEARKVRAAIKAFNENGLKALEKKKAKGMEPKFTEEVKKKILEHFSKEPKEYGYAFTVWTLPRFRKHLMESKVVEKISVEKVRQIINKAGAKLKKSKRWQYSPDKDFLKNDKK